MEVLEQKLFKIISIDVKLYVDIFYNTGNVLDFR